jgi:hypothetical protein
MPLQEPRYRNSAGRLLAILTSFPKDKQVWDFLPELMTGTPGKSTQEKHQICSEELYEIQKLYHQFQQDMLDVSDHTRKETLSNLKNIYQIVYPAGVNQVARLLTESERTALQIVQTMIPEEDKLEKNDLDAIRESIASLRQLVEESDISPALRKALLELIRLSEESISRFNIRGASGLKRAFKSMLGEASSLYLSEAAKGKEAETEFAHSRVWQTIVSHIKTVDRIAGRILKYQPLLEKGFQLLLGAPDRFPI